ncbi:MAG: methionyl-tRNA formyltransferase [Chlamydiales bacterium]
MRIGFFGTSRFAAAILESLLEAQYNIIAVVTRVDAKQGRNLSMAYSPVKKLALSFPSIPIFQPEKASASDFISAVSALQPDLFLVVAYGKILRETLLAIPKRGSINIHASLLPKYRGAAPIQRALMNGDEKSGVTIIEITPEMDAGDILEKSSIFIPPDMTFGQLENEMIIASCKILPRVIQSIESGIIKKRKQDDNAATYANKIDKTDLKILWEKPAYVIHNQIRAFSPDPGAWTNLILSNGIKKRLKILLSHPHPASIAPAGTVIEYTESKWLVSCGQESALEVLLVQLEGKKRCSYREFVRGNKIKGFF